LWCLDVYLGLGSWGSGCIVFFVLCFSVCLLFEWVVVCEVFGWLGLVVFICFVLWWAWFRVILLGVIEVRDRLVLVVSCVECF